MSIEDVGEFLFLWLFLPNKSMYIASWLGEFFRIRKIPPMNIANLTISLGKKF